MTRLEIELSAGTIGGRPFCMLCKTNIWST